MIILLAILLPMEWFRSGTMVVLGTAYDRFYIDFTVFTVVCFQ
jgi:hypothetical protein